jgi:DNA-binding NarL/FixJ family response regulator
MTTSKYAVKRDGKEALAKFPACRPDVVLLDIHMPRMNGIETASIMTKSWKQVAIIGICAVLDTYTTDAFLKAGALALVSKDRYDDLHSTIQRACRRA